MYVQTAFKVHLEHISKGKNMTVVYILLTNNPGSEVEIIRTIKGINRNDQSVKYEIQGVNGVYDIVVRAECNSMNDMKDILKEIRKIDKITSTTTMLVNEEQEGKTMI